MAYLIYRYHLKHCKHINNYNPALKKACHDHGHILDDNFIAAISVQDFRCKKLYLYSIHYKSRYLDPNICDPNILNKHFGSRALRK